MLALYLDTTHRGCLLAVRRWSFAQFRSDRLSTSTQPLINFLPLFVNKTICVCGHPAFMCCAQTEPTDETRNTHGPVHPQGVSVRVYHTRSFYHASPSEIHKQILMIVPASGLKINLDDFQTLRAYHLSADPFQSSPETIWHAYRRNYTQRHIPNLARVRIPQPRLHIQKQTREKF